MKLRKKIYWQGDFPCKFIWVNGSSDSKDRQEIHNFQANSLTWPLITFTLTRMGAPMAFKSFAIVFYLFKCCSILSFGPIWEVKNFLVKNNVFIKTLSTYHFWNASHIRPFVVVSFFTMNNWLLKKLCKMKFKAWLSPFA